MHTHRTSSVPALLRTVALAAAALAAAALAPAPAQASTVHGLRDFIAALPPGSYPVQQPTAEWTFHVGSHAGSLLTPVGANYRNTSDPYQQLGALVDTGTTQCTPGFCPANVASTRATFDGVFVHPGAGSATVAVFHAAQALTLDAVELWSETVANGSNGNGFDVTVNAILGGSSLLIGSFVFDYANTLDTALQSLYLPNLQLAAGDKVEIRYGHRGSYLYDHGNVNAWVRTSAAASTPPPSAVPEPGSAALAGLALLVAAAGRRRRD